jgi:hypothetical protein
LISLIFNSFTVSSEGSIAEVYTKLSNAPYSEQHGWGFENVSQSTEVISATLIKRNATFIFNYDPVEREMVRRQIDVFVEIRFELDYNYQLLYVYGQASYLPQLRSAIRNTLDQSFTLTQSDLTPYRIHTALNESQRIFEIQSMSIERFVYENGISGKLLGNVINNKIAVDLMEQYKTDVNKAIFKINIEGEQDLTIQASNHGAVKFYCQPDEMETQLNEFKNILFTKTN